MQPVQLLVGMQPQTPALQRNGMKLAEPFQAHLDPPVGTFSGHPPWLVHHSNGARCVHPGPDKAQHAAGQPAQPLAQLLGARRAFVGGRVS